MINSNSSLEEIAKAIFQLNNEVLAIVQRHISVPPAPTEIKAEEKKSLSPVRKSSKPPRVRRTDDEVEKMVTAISAVVAAHANDGIGSAGIRDVLRKNRFDLAHPLRLAVQKGLVEQRGAKKGARYYAPAREQNDLAS